MYIMIFIYLLISNEGAPPPSPFPFLAYLKVVPTCLDFPLQHLLSFKLPQAKIILSLQYITVRYTAEQSELLPEYYVNQTHMLSKTVMQCNECLSTIIQL